MPPLATRPSLHPIPSIPPLPESVRRPPIGEGAVGITKPPAGGEAGEQSLRPTFVARGLCCPMRVSPNFQRALLTNQGQRSVLLMRVMTCIAKLRKSSPVRWTVGGKLAKYLDNTTPRCLR
ncbi:MAG TPA: hypothetical protein EYM64_03330 [Phycisphaerales bacterium]|nr:hypothetical protein [Phycisphaerales bacterium]